MLNLDWILCQGSMTLLNYTLQRSFRTAFYSLTNYRWELGRKQNLHYVNAYTNGTIVHLLYLFIYSLNTRNKYCLIEEGLFSLNTIIKHGFRWSMKTENNVTCLKSDKWVNLRLKRHPKIWKTSYVPKTV